MMVDLLRPRVIGAAAVALVMGFLSGLGVGTVVAGPAPAKTASVKEAKGPAATPPATGPPESSPVPSESLMKCELSPRWQPINQPKFVFGMDVLQPGTLADGLDAEKVEIAEDRVIDPSTGAKAFEDEIKSKAMNAPGVVLMRLGGNNQRNGAMAAANRYSDLWFVLLLTDDSRDADVDLSKYPPRTVAVRIGGERKTARLDPVSQVPNVVQILKDEVSCDSVTKGSST